MLQKPRSYKQFVAQQIAHLEESLTNQEVSDVNKQRINVASLPFFHKLLSGYMNEEVLKKKLDERYMELNVTVNSSETAQEFAEYLKFAYRISLYKEVVKSLTNQHSNDDDDNDDLPGNPDDKKKKYSTLSTDTEYFRVYDQPPAPNSGATLEPRAKDDQPEKSNPYGLLVYVGIGVASLAVAATALYLCRNTKPCSKFIGMIKEFWNNIGNSLGR